MQPLPSLLYPLCILLPLSSVPFLQLSLSLCLTVRWTLTHPSCRRFTPEPLPGRRRSTPPCPACLCFSSGHWSEYLGVREMCVGERGQEKSRAEKRGRNDYCAVMLYLISLLFVSWSSLSFSLFSLSVSLSRCLSPSLFVSLRLSLRLSLSLSVSLPLSLSVMHRSTLKNIVDLRIYRAVSPTWGTRRMLGVFQTVTQVRKERETDRERDSERVREWVREGEGEKEKERRRRRDRDGLSGWLTACERHRVRRRMEKSMRERLVQDSVPPSIPPSVITSSSLTLSSVTHQEYGGKPSDVTITPWQLHLTLFSALISVVSNPTRDQLEVYVCVSVYCCVCVLLCL